jgi:hypothetical protein
MTLGSSVSSPKNESGVTPLARSRAGASSRSWRFTANATWRVMPSGADPRDHNPSIERESGIHRKVAARSGTSSATGKPTTSR